jgi:hypothetical protein
MTAQFKDIMGKTHEVLCKAKTKANVAQREMCLLELRAK